MKLRTIGATLALLLLARGETLAQDKFEDTSLVPVSPASEAPARLALAMPTLFFGLDSPSSLEAVVPVTAAVEYTQKATETTIETVTFHPRRGRWHRSPPRSEAVIYQSRTRSTPVSSGPPTAFMQLHGGFIEREGHGATSFAAGFRCGPQVGEGVQLGIGADWYHESESQRQVVAQNTQGGRDITTTNVLSRTSADLVPIQAHVQLNLGSRRSGIFPYFGAAGGYQILFLSAEDYQTGASYDATFGGWGWQAFGGLSLRLSNEARLFGEAFMNIGDVERDVQDPSGTTYREVTNTDGGGMRFGLNWGI